LNGGASIGNTLATDETVSGVQGNCSHVVTTEMLGDLKNETVLSSLDLKCVENGGKITVELDVDDGTNNLGNSSGGFLTSREESYTRVRGGLLAYSWR